MKYLLSFIFLILISCSEKQTENKPQTVSKISVSNYPLFWICSELAPKSCQINYPIPEKIDPAFWEPESSAIQEIISSDLIFLNGATYEKWLTTITLPTSKVINTTAGLEDKFIKIKNATTHIHNGQSHSHDGTAFTTWLDSQLMKMQLKTVSTTLQVYLPQQAGEIRAREENLIKKLSEINDSLSSAFHNKKAFLASHPVYQYLQQGYQLDIKSFLWEPGVMPTEVEWQKVQNAKSHSNLMLWEDEPKPEIKKRLKSMGITCIIFRTCGNTPPSKNYISEMQQNIVNLKSGTNEHNK